MRLLAVLALLTLLGGSAEARPLKGTGPTTIGAGHGAAWVGFGDGTITRVDSKTLTFLSHHLSGGARGYITSIAMGFASVWVSPAGMPVHRLHPRTASVRARVANQPGSWSGSPAQVATGAGFAWIADHERNAILRVDARTNRAGRRLAVPGRLRSIAPGRNEVWVQTVPGRGPVSGPAGMRVVWRLDPRTLQLTRAFRLPCDARLLPSGGSIWVLDACDGVLRRFDGNARRLSGPLGSPGALALSAGFGSIWVSDGSTVRRTRDGRVVAEIPVRGLAAAGAGFVWVLDMGDGVTGWLRRIDPATNRVVGRAIRLSAR